MDGFWEKHISLYQLYFFENFLIYSRFLERTLIFLLIKSESLDSYFIGLTPAHIYIFLYLLISSWITFACCKGAATDPLKRAVTVRSGPSILTYLLYHFISLICFIFYHSYTNYGLNSSLGPQLTVIPF